MRHPPPRDANARLRVHIRAFVCSDMVSPSSEPAATPVLARADDAAAAASAPHPSSGGGKASGIRRSRPSYSCDRCRTRRVKCDQLRPKCSNCARNEVGCIYGEPSRKRKAKPAEDVRKESPTKPVQRGAEADEKRTSHGSLLTQNGGRSRYIESTFWASVDIEGLELGSLLFDLPLFPLEDACCAACKAPATLEASKSPCQHYVGTSEPNFSFWTSRYSTRLRADTRSLASTLSELPPRETCDDFYKVFVESVHPLIPLVHLPTFDRHYRRFWDWYMTSEPGHAPEGVLAECPGFLPLLFTVLFTGSIAWSHPDDGNIQTLLVMQKKLYYLIPGVLAMVGFPYNPSLYSLMAFLLLHSMLIREEEALGSCSFVAVAFRVCQAMGLHKDGTDFGLDDIQVEERRRVWCHLMHLDVMTSIVSGLPLVASSEMFSSTQMIREVCDDYLGRRDEDGETSPVMDANYIVTAGRYDATSCIRGILLRQFSPRAITSVCVKNIEERIEALHSRTEKRIERLSLLSQQGSTSPFSMLHSLSPGCSGDIGGDPDSRIQWGKDLLHMMVEKAYCILYQPTMRDTSLWKEIRPRAVPRFQSFLSIFIEMSTTELYSPYQWLYPGAYQPLQPVAVLLVDLLNSPRSVESPRSRALLEKAFSMLGPGGRMTNGSLNVNSWQHPRYASVGSKQTWMRLEKLRSRVWHNLGLDHNVLWMRSISANAAQSKCHAPEPAQQREISAPRYSIGLEQINDGNSLAVDSEAEKYATPLIALPFFGAADQTLTA